MTSIKIFQSMPISTSLAVPSSKSYGHRALIVAAMAKGTSRIKGLPENQDVLATLDCLKKLGVSIEKKKDEYLITGTDGKFKWNQEILDCHESGSTLRFLIPLALTNRDSILFKGEESLLKRPLGVYEQIAREKGYLFHRSGNSLLVRGPLQAGSYQVDGSISSQFISGLFFGLSLLSQDSEIILSGLLVSKQYVDLSLDILSLAKIQIDRTTTGFRIHGNQDKQAFEYEVEGDYSAAAFWITLEHMHGQKIGITNLKEKSLQADRAIYDSLKNLEEGNPVDLLDCPDLGPVLMAYAATLSRKSHFLHVHRLREKECDRLEAMQSELTKLGVLFEIQGDEAWIEGRKQLISGQTLSGHQDHRIVMSLAILATIIQETTIDGVEAIQKSYPNFLEDFQSLGLTLERIFHETNLDH